MQQRDWTAAKKGLQTLRDELDALSRENDSSSGIVELDPSKVGRLSRMDAMQAQAMAKASGRRREVMRQKIDAALRRIDRGEYGDCSVCGQQIAAERLAFDPAVLMCIGCAESSERNA